MPARKRAELIAWVVEVRSLSKRGYESLFTTNYLARTKDDAERMAVSNALRPGGVAILATAKRSPKFERLQRSMYRTSGDECAQGTRPGPKRNRKCG